MTGLLSILVLLLTEDFSYSAESAFEFMAIIGALRYSIPILTGLITDKLLNTNASMFLGSLLQSIGFLCAFANHDDLAFGISLVVVGYAFLKPNITIAYSELLRDAGEPERNRKFALFYSMGNLGGFCAPLAFGYIGSAAVWSDTFLLGAAAALSIVFMIISSTQLQIERQITIKDILYVLISGSVIVSLSTFLIEIQLSTWTILLSALTVSIIIFIAQALSAVIPPENNRI